MKNQAWGYIRTILSVTYFVCMAATLANAASTSEAQSVTAALTANATQDWNSLVDAAKKEGKVVIYTSWGPPTRMAITKAFKAKYGIDVEFSLFSRTSELLAKVQTEERAGLHLADVFGAGSNAFYSLLKPAGVLGAMEPMLVLPEVIDGRNWRSGRVPFLDKEKTFIAMVSVLQRNIFYNTDMVKKGEITDYLDILKPRYKGKIIMNDPTITGAGGDFMIHLSVNIWDLARAKAYLTQLVGQQQIVIERDNRIQVESVARGKYPIGLAPNTDTLTNLLNAGAPLDVVYFKQGVREGAAAGDIGVPTKQAHPNAAKLFVNWLLTKEGQTVFSKGFGNPSRRTDVTSEGFNLMFLPQPGEKLFPESEEYMRRANEVLKMAKQVISAANK